MKRKIYQQLLHWKNTKQGKTALLIEGARRVGKSYIAEEFGRREYDSYLLVDFSKAAPVVKSLFDLYLDDIDQLLARLEGLYHKHLTRRQSLIIFDEVQFCPRARMAIKFLVADGRYDYIETGSLISIKRNVKDILIPSEEHAIQMYPMDFEEFLWAVNDETTMPFVGRLFEQKQPLKELHRATMDRFREYLIVGGMPQAVQEYATSNNFDAVDEIKRDILQLYRNDIHKYAGNLEYKVLSIFDNIPGQLQKHEKKFTLSVINKDARMREYDDAFEWLEEAFLIHCAKNATAPNIGLRMNEERTTLKCYFLDTGLLISMAFDESGIYKEDLYNKLLYNKLEVNQGMLVENIVAQMLRTAGHQLYFFSKYDKNNPSETMEIDFLLAKSRITSRHNISLIEVKSSTGYTLSSLNKCRSRYKDYIHQSIVLHSKDVEVKDDILYLPLYMTGLL